MVANRAVAVPIGAPILPRFARPRPRRRSSRRKGASWLLPATLALKIAASTLAAILVALALWRTVGNVVATQSLEQGGLISAVRALDQQGRFDSSAGQGAQY